MLLKKQYGIFTVICPPPSSQFPTHYMHPSVEIARLHARGRLRRCHTQLMSMLNGLLTGPFGHRDD
jgi:hypothetical protein